MLKKFIALILCVLLVLSFAACKKDKNDVDSSSNQTTSDPTQDYENDEWNENENLTKEEKEEVENLWNDLVQNGGAEIRDPDNNSSTGSSKPANGTANEFDDEQGNQTSGTDSSSQVSSSKPDSSEEESSSAGSSSDSTPAESSKPASSATSSTTSSETEDKDDDLVADVTVSRPAIW